MYGLNRDVDLSFLTGREVIQVAVGTYQVQFHFDEDVNISVEGEFKYFDGKDETTWSAKPESAHVAARTVALLGAVIEGYKACYESGTLELNFSHGHRLTIPDSSKEYESYSITRPGFNLYV